MIQQGSTRGAHTARTLRIACAIGVLAFISFCSGCDPNAGKVQVPALVNLTLGDATSQIYLLGLKLGEVTEINSETAEGNIAGQSPQSGAYVNPGELIALQVSLGPADSTPQLPQRIGVSTSQLLLDLTTHAQAFEVWNTDPAVALLEIQVQPVQTWLSVDVAAVSSTAPNTQLGILDRRPIRVGVDRSALAAGTHLGLVRLTSPGVQPVDVTVQVIQDDTLPTSFTIENVRTTYAKPYLIQFDFNLRRPDGLPLIAEPVQFEVIGREQDQQVDPGVTGLQLRRRTANLLRVFLVLDYSASVANVAGMIQAVEQAVNTVLMPALTLNSQIGAYEFHHQDAAPRRVFGFSVDRQFAAQALTSINGSIAGAHGMARAWDALGLAAREFEGTPPPAEERIILFVTAGQDASSVESLTSVQSAIAARGVRVFAIALGDANLASLQGIAEATGGEVFAAPTGAEVTPALSKFVSELDGQYSLRWASLRRGASGVRPSFALSMLGITRAYSEQNVFVPDQHAAEDLRGRLRFERSDNESKTTAFLRADYIPRFIRRIRIYFKSNLPFTISRVDTVDDGLLAGWEMTTIPDPATGGTWLDAESLAGPLAYATYGPMLRIDFDGYINPLLPLFTRVYFDNDCIYLNGQSLRVEGYEPNTPPEPYLPCDAPQ